MSSVTQQQVEAALQQYVDPYLNKNIVAGDMVKSIAVEGGKVSVEVELGYPAASVKESMQDAIAEKITAIAGVEQVEVALGWKIIPYQVQNNLSNMDNVKNIIAVASGKGGVGKSTTAVNLALALVKEGARVGILDADIYGPSQQMMLGVDEDAQPETIEQKFFVPVPAQGLQTMSMGYLVTEKTPLVWRGPMTSSALQQMLNQTRWDDLDYLIIDLPPGTGDIQLTLSQQVPVAGSVIVTTPQDIALIDAKKGVEMFNRVGVPVLGVVENMAVHVCSNCGHKEHIFGDSGGQRFAKEYGVEVLGSLPLAMEIREQTDNGNPSVVADPDGDIAKTYGEIARKMAAELVAQNNTVVNVFPQISINDD